MIEMVTKWWDGAGGGKPRRSAQYSASALCPLPTCNNSAASTSASNFLCNWLLQWCCRKCAAGNPFWLLHFNKWSEQDCSTLPIQEEEGGVLLPSSPYVYFCHVLLDLPEVHLNKQVGWSRLQVEALLLACSAQSVCLNADRTGRSSERRWMLFFFFFRWRHSRINSLCCTLLFLPIRLLLFLKPGRQGERSSRKKQGLSCWWGWQICTVSGYRPAWTTWVATVLWPVLGKEWLENMVCCISSAHNYEKAPQFPMM